ncbi:MAG: FAD:protein FMN transferase [Bryobacterales bacterium]|nr:FAD:protein FMN transferase [Bryobacterales bacterium]
MGTGWSIACYSEPQAAPHVRARVEAELECLVRQMSHWREHSELCGYNRAPAGTWVAVPPEFHRVVTAALEVAAKSGGAFDPSLGRAVDRWGFGPAGRRDDAPPPPPPPGEAGRWREIELRPGAFLQPGGVSLDLSSIAKGFAVDRIAELLANAGLVSFLVEVGGELRARGVKPNGQPWWVAVEPPPGLPAEVGIKVALSGWSIATSGDYRRYFEHEGRRYAHTLDPATGAPLAAPPASVSVLHPECMMADAWSTALMVLGETAGLALCERHELAAVFIYREPFRAVASPAFRAALAE